MNVSIQEIGMNLKDIFVFVPTVFCVGSKNICMYIYIYIYIYIYMYIYYWETGGAIGE